MQDTLLREFSTADNLLIGQAQIALEVGHIVALVGISRQITQLLQYSALHLLGSLIGEGYGEDGTIEIGLSLEVFNRVVYEFIRQAIGLTRTCAGTQYLCSHITIVCRLPYNHNMYTERIYLCSRNR